MNIDYLRTTAVMSIYYIDKSVLVENRPLIKFIRNYIRDLSGCIFHILTSEDIDDVISHFNIVVCAKILLSI